MAEHTPRHQQPDHPEQSGGTTRPLGAIEADVVALLTSYRDADAESRTPILRSLATALVDARSHFDTRAGGPDWLGRTYAYRTWVARTFTEAGYATHAERAPITAATRYHVGAEIRSRLDEETLAAYGLDDRTPKVRVRERRATRTALLSRLLAEHEARQAGQAAPGERPDPGPGTGEA